MKPITPIHPIDNKHHQTHNRLLLLVAIMALALPVGVRAQGVWGLCTDTKGDGKPDSAATSTIAWPQMSLDDGPWHTADTLVLTCVPATLRLRDTNIGHDCQWALWNALLPTDTLRFADTTVSVRIDTVGTYGFRLVAIDTNGHADTVRRDTLLVAFARPEADFNWWPERLPFHAPEAQFHNLSQPDSATLLWLFAREMGSDTFDSAFVTNPTYAWAQLSEPGDYTVSLVAHWLHHGPDTLTHTCTDTATHAIAIVNTYLQFPNTVTPNADGINDRWEVVNLLEMGEYPINELWIYNAWGQLVHHAKNIRDASGFWDPNDGNCPDGTYYFHFTAKSQYGIVKRNGAIEVIREN